MLDIRESRSYKSRFHYLCDEWSHTDIWMFLPLGEICHLLTRFAGKGMNDRIVLGAVHKLCNTILEILKPPPPPLHNASIS